MKINILGTEYDFAETTRKEDVRLSECDGYCDFYEKTIRVETDYNENDPNAIKDFDALKSRVKRHEVIHAFLFESGLTKLAEDEQLVDWISVQFPKMLKTFQETGGL